MTTVIDSDDDLKWLRDVHNVPRETKFAILYGTEDAPDTIECWYTECPRYDQPPDYIIKRVG